MTPRHITILVVEDDPQINEMLRELLKDEGYHVVTAVDGQAAFQIAARIRPDVVITDIHMETPDAGFQLLNRLRNEPDTSRVKVLICSADSQALFSQHDMVTALDARLLPKPFHIERLLASIQEAIEERGL